MRFQYIYMNGSHLQKKLLHCCTVALSKWQVKDKVIVPANLPVGEYVLSWRWDCYMADQIWSNCADVEITNSPGTQTTTVASTTTTTGTESTASSTSSSSTSSSSGCVDGELPTEWSQSGRFDCNYFENEEPRTQIHWRIAHMLPFETHAASVSRVCGNAELYGVGTVGMRCLPSSRMPK